MLAVTPALTFNSDGSFNYVPNTNYYGVDSFTYQASDGTADSNGVHGLVRTAPESGMTRKQCGT